MVLPIWGSSACCASACHQNRGGSCPLGLPRCSVIPRSRRVSCPDIEQTPDGKPSGVRQLAAQARAISSEAGLAPSGSPAAQFHSAAASFLPKHRTNPRWFYPSGVRRLAAQARVIPPEAGLAPSGSPAAQFRNAAASHHHNIEQTPDGKPPGVRSIERRI